MPLVEMTVSNEFHPLVRKRLAEIVQLLQTYARLAELEINAGERPRTGDVALSKDLPERIAEWAEGEEATERDREELVGELSQAMRAHGHDPTPIREAMGGEAGRLCSILNRYAVARHVVRSYTRPRS